MGFAGMFEEMVLAHQDSDQVFQLEIGRDNRFIDIYPENAAK
jgi:hypothetical protein